MPTYMIKCKKCKYTGEVFMLYSAFEKYLKEEVCPKCKGELAQEYRSGGGFIMNAKEKRRQNRKGEASLHRQRLKRNHERKVKKDPYYEFR